MKKILLSLLAAALLFCSCGRKELINETRTFANNTWLRFQPESFSVQADNTDDCFNFYLTMHIDTSLFHEAGLPVMIEMKSSEGENRTLFNTILFRNHEGTWLGNIDNNGILEVTQMVRQFYFFNVTGTHTVDVSQRTSKYEISGIHDMTFKIEKAKIEYPE